jgi:hypothetical protein
MQSNAKIIETTRRQLTNGVGKLANERGDVLRFGWAMGYAGWRCSTLRQRQVGSRIAVAVFAAGVIPSSEKNDASSSTRVRQRRIAVVGDPA